jgi:HSP20 family protein
MPKDKNNRHGALLAPILPITADWFDRLGQSFWRAAGAGLIKVEETTKDGKMTVRAEAPGVDPDNDIDISVENDRLRISVRRTEKQENKDKDHYRSEFSYGSFTRSIQLPPGTTDDAITATYRDGIIEVTIPAPQPATSAKKIEISH